MSKQPVIFCDFDGTITESDNIISIMKHFAPPEWEALKDGVWNQTLSIKKGVGKMFSLLPSTLKDEIIQYVKEIGVLRAGFGKAGDGYVRVGLLTDEGRLQEAVNRLEKLELFD